MVKMVSVSVLCIFPLKKKEEKMVRGDCVETGVQNRIIGQRNV